MKSIPLSKQERGQNPEILWNPSSVMGSVELSSKGPIYDDQCLLTSRPKNVCTLILVLHRPSYLVTN